MANENIQELKFQVGEAWKGVYSSSTAYGLANVVQDPTGLSIYRSLKSGNVGHPLSDASWWFRIIDMSSIKAESDRIAALNEAIAQDEALRVAAEELRQQHEEARIAAETQRNEAEQARVNAEQARVNAESARATAEQQRITAEQGRVSAESARVQAEQARALSETLRANAEDQRAANEQNRIAAEQQRIERAEQDHDRAESDHAALQVYFDSLGAFDISSYHATDGVLAKYADLAAALGTNGANIPDALRKGGMSVKFVLSSDNKYVQYRLMSDTFNTTVVNWQGVDDEPTAGSNYLVKSGGVYIEFQDRNKTNTLQFTTTNWGKPYKIEAGKDYILKNAGASSVTVVTRATIDGENIDIVHISAGNTVTLTATADANYIRCAYNTTLEISNIDNDINSLNEKIDSYYNILTEKEESIIKSELNLAYNNNAKFGFDIVSDGSNTNVEIINRDIVFPTNRKYTISTTSEDSITIRSYNVDDELTQLGTVTSGSPLVIERTSIFKGLYALGASSTIGHSWHIEIMIGSEIIDDILSINSDRLVTNKGINASVDAMALKTVLTFVSPSNIHKRYNIIAGHSYKVTNKGDSTITIFTRNKIGGTNIETISSNLHAGETVDFNPANNALFIYSNYDIEVEIVDTSNDINAIDTALKAFVLQRDKTFVLNFKSTSISASDLYFPLKEGDVYEVTNNTGTTCVLAVKETRSGSPIVVVNNFAGYSKKTFTVPANANYIRCSYNTNITFKNLSNSVNKIDNELNTLPLGEFNLVGDSIEDMSSLFAKFDYSNGMYQTNIMEQIYAEFDKLVALYPDYIEKYDPMALSDSQQVVTIDNVNYTITIHALDAVRSAMATKGFNDYPEYANGINTPVTRTFPIGDGNNYEVVYEQTPAYKTYMYRLKDNTNALYEDPYKPDYSIIPKKIMLVAGTHGNEKLAPFDLYALANGLCTGSNANLFKLRTSVEIYMVPYLNGYGAYHNRRSNGNWVDINRNAPTKNWQLAYVSDLTEPRNPLGCSYSGSEACNQFETSLIVSLFNYLNPKIAIDHHNYGNEGTVQFYTDYANSINLRPIIARCCVDVCKELIDELPAYFGNKFKLFISALSIGAGRSATLCNWFGESGADMAFTLEVGHSINFINGEINSGSKPTFTSDVANIAVYTFIHQLLVYVDWILKH